MFGLMRCALFVLHLLAVQSPVCGCLYPVQTGLVGACVILFILVLSLSGVVQYVA